MSQVFLIVSRRHVTAQNPVGMAATKPFERIVQGLIYQYRVLEHATMFPSLPVPPEKLDILPNLHLECQILPNILPNIYFILPNISY